MKDKFIHVCFIVDESSSMYGSENDIVNGFKKIVDEQRNEEGSCAISLYKFASNVTKVYIGKNVHEIEQLPYKPWGCTALYDGIGMAITEIGKWLNNIPEEERPEKNLVVIMTDGEENSSHEYKLSQVKEMIKHQEEKYNWTFMYIGADVTNANDAYDLGITYKTASTKTKMGNSFGILNDVISCYKLSTAEYATDNLEKSFCSNTVEYLSDTGIDINANYSAIKINEDSLL